MMGLWGRSRTAVLVAALVAAVGQERPTSAQSANSNAGLQGGQDGMFDAILATPNYRTPVLPDSALATAPGLEQAVPTPQFTLNVLAPALYNSNAQFLSSGGSKTLEGSPLVRRLGEPAVRYADQSVGCRQPRNRAVCQCSRRCDRLHPHFRTGTVCEPGK